MLRKTYQFARMGRSGQHESGLSVFEEERFGSDGGVHRRGLIRQDLILRVQDGVRCSFTHDRGQ